MNSCLSYRDERIKNGVASPPLSIIVAIVIPSLPFVRCGKNQWRGPRPAKGRGPLFRSIRLSDRQNDGVDIGARVGERPCGQIVPFHPRSEEHTSELPSLMRNSYAVFCWKKK